MDFGKSAVLKARAAGAKESADKVRRVASFMANAQEEGLRKVKVEGLSNYDRRRWRLFLRSPMWMVFCGGSLLIRLDQ